MSVPNYEFRYVDVDELLPNPHRPRFKVDRSELLKLADSIRQYGLFQPILVGKTAAGLQVIAGERRWRAAKLAGLKTIPIMLIEASSVDLILFFLEENLQRQSVNLLEQAEAIKKLCAKSGFTMGSVAKRLKIDEQILEQIAATADLPEKVKNAYLDDKLTNEELLEILKTQDPLEAIHSLKS